MREIDTAMNPKTSRHAPGLRAGTVFFPTLRSKLIVSFSLLFVVTFVIAALTLIYGIPFSGIKGAYDRDQAEAFRNLNLVADLKKERLRRWIEERRDDTKVLSRSPIISSYVSGALPVIQKQGLLRELQKVEGYKTMVDHLKVVRDSYGVYGAIQIADARSGMVIASTRIKDVGKDISKEVFYTEIQKNESHELISFGQVHGGGDINLVISRWIEVQGRTGKDRTAPALLIMYVDSEDFISPMLHTGGGLGRSGEALLVNQDQKILTSLKHPLADGSRAEPLHYRIEAKPAMLAAQGEEGIITAEDYRGVPVLAAYRHFRITPELGWGMVVKRDRSEIFGHYNTSIRYLAVIGLIAVGIVIVVSVVLAKKISQPIEALGRAARGVEAGDLTARAPLAGTEEVVRFATTFNSMVERIHHWHRELEEQVSLRTVELNQRNKELQTEISERKKIEANLESQAKELARSNTALQQFAYVASHDLQEPLRMVSSYVQLLEKRYKGRLDADADDFIHFAVDGIQRMQDLINDLLAYSRVGTKGKAFAQTDCEALLKRALGSLKIAIIESGAVITHDPLPTVMADSSQLVQVFQNLILNAVRFQGDEAPRIHISAEENGMAWRFSVRDNGIGIEPEYHKRIFVLFQRLHGRKDCSGTGMGLAICKKIVERHGGHIWVDSRSGEGAVFNFTLSKGTVVRGQGAGKE